MDRALRAACIGAAGAAVLVALAAPAAHAAATMRLTTATVANPGDSARLCVSLSTGGHQIAGTQNDLVWDGNCASLADESSCSVAGSHGKQLSAATKCGDFCLRAILLSLSDVDPMPDGPLYCCNFQSEASAGNCCMINMTNTAASDSDGTAIGAQGVGAQICTGGSQDQPGRGGMGGGVDQPLSAGNTLPGADAGVAPAPAAPAAQPGGAAPPAQVLQGGGVRVEYTPPAGSAPAAAAPQLPTLPAAPAPTAAAGAVAPQAAEPALPPPTAAATQAPTSPAPQDTPTRRATVAATRVATKASAPPKAADAQPAAPAESRGWFGCQIGAGASVAPVIGLGLLALVGVLARRRSKSRTQRSRGGYGNDE